MQPASSSVPPDSSDSGSTSQPDSGASTPRPNHGPDATSSREDPPSNGRVFNASPRGKARGKSYAKGSPPGPGRPKGCRNKVSADLRSLFETHAPGVLTAAIIKARKGEIAALKLFFPLIESYITRIEIALPEIRCTADIPVFQAAVMKAFQRGKITAPNAASLFDLSDRMRIAFETEFEGRVFGSQPFTIPDPPDISNPDPSDANSDLDSDPDSDGSVEDEANAQ